MTVKIREQLLIRRVRKNDQAAFGEIYDGYIKKIYRFVFFRVSAKEIAEDISHDVFTSLLNYLKNKENEIKNLQAFLYQIARNKIADHYEQANREKTTTWQEERAAEVLTEKEQTDELDLNKLMDDQLAVEKISMAIKQIKNVEWQEAIIMRFVEDLSIKEIAVIWQKKTGTVRVILHRAMQELKQQIEKQL